MANRYSAGTSTGSLSPPPNSQEKSPGSVFVGWVPGSENAPRKTAPRLHHKKSRTGCQQCRARRVKVCFWSFQLAAASTMARQCMHMDLTIN
jgi:hypothetical protein